MSSPEVVLVEVVANVAVVTLNRPESLNAVSRDVVHALRDLLPELRANEDVGAVIFTGAGDQAFAAGADIGELEYYTLHTGLEAAMQVLYDQIESFEKPTIAAVNGYALGGGCELAMACDIRIAAEEARFGLPETALGVLPGAGGTQRLARLVGVGRTTEMILTGRTLRAEEALSYGLVTRVVPAKDLLAEAQSVAARIFEKGPLAVRLATLVVRTGMDADRRTGQVIERLAQSLLYTSKDKQEGAQAFLANRQPDFKGE